MISRVSPLTNLGLGAADRRTLSKTVRAMQAAAARRAELDPDAAPKAPESSIVSDDETALAKRSLHAYTKQAWPYIESQPFVDNWHIGCVAEHLQAVTEGQIDKLLINIPPGFTKSLLTCVLWPTWEWGPAGHPHTRWFYSSYDQRLSTRDSVKCRTLLNSWWYQKRWGDTYSLKPDQNQKTYYETDMGGYRLATSVGGHGTGEHPDRIVCDDPHNVKEAESDVERQSTIDWWDLTMSTRGVSRKASRVVIMQRLHEADLSGHIIDQGGYVHICLPMHYEPKRMIATPLGWNDPRTKEGELLSPNLFTPAMVAELERSLGPYGAAGQLEQRPAPKAGGFFQLKWFTIVEKAPQCEAYVRAWDKAGTEGGGDWTVGELWGRKGDELYLIDVVRGQWGSGRRDDAIDLIASQDFSEYGSKVKTWFEQEPGSGGKQSAEVSKSRLSRAGYRVDYEVVTGTKEARADQLSSAASLGRVKIVKAAWNKVFLDELIVFPNGKHDDQVDAASMAFNKLSATGRRLLVAQ